MKSVIVWAVEHVLMAPCMKKKARIDRMRYKCIKEICLLDSLNDDSDFGWIEMSFEELKENFILISD